MKRGLVASVALVIAIVGWWMTYPVEPIEGVMVAQVNTLDQARRRSARAPPTCGCPVRR